MAEVMKAIPFTQFSMEMRSGKIIDIDDGFTELLGYTEDDFEAGIVFKQFVPSVEYEEVITELREKFIDKRYVSYVQEFVSKDGKPLKVVAFYKIENKLLAGHRVLALVVIISMITTLAGCNEPKEQESGVTLVYQTDNEK